MSPEEPTTPTGVAATSPQEVLRRRMFRLWLMAGLILAGVAALAVAAAVLGMDAHRQQVRAEGAERRSLEQLWKSYLDQASALRQQGLQGRRTDGLSALQKAAQGWLALHAGDGEDAPERLQLRDEAAALLSLSDIRVSRPPVTWPEHDTLIAVDADQQLLATSDSGAHISVRRLEDGVPLLKFEPDKSFAAPRYLSGLAWRPRVEGAAGRTWLCGWFKSGDVALWEFPGGKMCYSWHTGSKLMGGGPSPGAFSLDGRFMAWFKGDQSSLTIIDLEKGSVLEHHLKPGRTSFAIRPHTHQIAYAGKEGIDVIDLLTGEIKRSWPVSGAMHTLAWSADGKQLAGMGWTGEVSLWRMDSKVGRTLTGHTAPGRALVFSPDGLTLMSTSQDSTTRWWDTVQGTLRLTSITGQGFCYNPAGDSICFEANSGGIGRWAVLPSAVHETVAVANLKDVGTLPFDLSPDGKCLVAGLPGGLGLFKTDGSHRVFPWFLPRASQYTFAPDGDLLMLDAGKIVRKHLEETPEGGLTLTAAPVVPVQFPAGETPRMISLGQDGHTVLLEFASLRYGTTDLRGGSPFHLLQSRQNMVYWKGGASCTGGGRFALSPDGRLAALAYGTRSGTTVFETAGGTEVFTTDTGAGHVLFTPDSRQLLQTTDGAIRILQASDGKELVRRELPGQLDGSSALAVTADGLLTAMAVSPQAMQLCRAGDLTPVLSLTPPVLRNVRNCRMSQDGSLLAVFSSGNEFLLWNVKAMRQELAALGLDWRDAARALPAAPAPLPAAAPVQGFMLWLGGAAIIAALSAVIMLRRHHGLMRDYSDAEATVMVQRKDLEQANFRLLHSQKMKALGTLAAGMAHDFNNMLSVIRMSNKLIARETRGNTEVSELVDSVEIAVLQGKQVVSSLLSYSRANEETSQPRPVADIVRETAILLNTEFLSGIILTLAVNAAAPEVRLAQGPVEQILLNLIVNAAEAMQGAGTLTIGVRVAPAEAVAACVLPPAPGASFLEISVSDSGPGIPPEVAGRIFEPFFTTKNAGNDRGTGLGLSMVYTIAERDGLGLAVHSSFGHGACFSIFVPVPETPVPPVRETPADNGPGYANQ